MKLHHIALAALAIATAAPATAALAASPSCYDLWYARNAIYDAHGFCFSTALGRETFDNSDCWTKYPKLSHQEQVYVANIQAVEKARQCKVN